LAQERFEPLNILQTAFACVGGQQHIAVRHSQTAFRRWQRFGVRQYALIRQVTAFRVKLTAADFQDRFERLSLKRRHAVVIGRFNRAQATARGIFSHDEAIRSELLEGSQFDMCRSRSRTDRDCSVNLISNFDLDGRSIIGISIASSGRLQRAIPMPNISSTDSVPPACSRRWAISKSVDRLRSSDDVAFRVPTIQPRARAICFKTLQTVGDLRAAGLRRIRRRRLIFWAGLSEERNRRGALRRSRPSASSPFLKRTHAELREEWAS